MTQKVLALDRRIQGGWLLVGFAFGGFFDGIVLHQILQWHHLLSGLSDATGGLRFQIMADGLFHLSMYVLAVSGAVLLVAAQASGARPGMASEILRLALIGFAVWHVVDAVVSHWLLGLHRIKMDSDMPLLWDIVWLGIFGIVPLGFAWVMPNRGGPTRGAAAALTSVTIVAGLAAGAGPRFNEADTIVLFRADLKPAAKMQAILAADTRLKWADASGSIWVLDRVSWSGLFALHARGALIVSSTPVLAGCLAWSRSYGLSSDVSRRPAGTI